MTKDQEEILLDPEKRRIWLSYIKSDQENLKLVIKLYATKWQLVREILAERGVEMTPEELKELTSFIKESLIIIENEEGDYDNDETNSYSF
jgi:hypothetical protein